MDDVSKVKSAYEEGDGHISVMTYEGNSTRTEKKRPADNLVSRGDVKKSECEDRVDGQQKQTLKTTSPRRRWRWC